MNKRNFSFDLIRIFACILVVLVHVSAVFVIQTDLSFSSRITANFYNCLGIIGVPLFFMLSGALLLQKKDSFSIKNFFFHHCVRILLLYFATIFSYNAVSFFFHQDTHTFSAFKNQVLLLTLCAEGDGIGHLWFLKSLFCLYLITPILKEAFQSEKNCRYFLLLFFTISILLNSILKFPIKYERILLSWQQAFSFDLILGYTGYYIAGYYLSHFFHPGRITKRLLAIFGITGFLLTTGLETYSFAEDSLSPGLFNEPFFIGQFLTAFFLFYVFLQLFAAHSPSGKLCQCLSGSTLFIYLFHPLVLRFFQSLGLFELGLPNILLIPFLTLIIVIVCFVLAQIIFLLKYLFPKKKAKIRN